jgi:hypothetical protein
MKQINFLLIFSFGLAMVMFTLENTAPTTVRFLPGLQATLPLAALLLVVGGIGATAAWVFAAWSGPSMGCSRWWAKGRAAKRSGGASAWG